MSKPKKTQAQQAIADAERAAKQAVYNARVGGRLDALGCGGYVFEHVFHPSRNWRLDVAWPRDKVFIEIDGVMRGDGGRHQRFDGYTEDCLKCAEAVRLGWVCYRFTWAQFDTINLAAYLRRYLPKTIKAAKLAAENSDTPAMSSAIKCGRCGGGTRPVRSQILGLLHECPKCKIAVR